MSVEEVTTESWGSRLGNSFKGVIGGGILFLAGIPLLFWNEGRAVKTTQALEEGEAACVSVPTVDSIDSLNEGKLIHATGNAVTQDVLSDDLFPGVSKKALKLRREVEYYQWVETEHSHTEKKVGGGTETRTTYTYSTKWVSAPVSSDEFKEAGHTNVVFYSGAEDKSLQAESASLGAFALTADQIGRIGGSKPLPLADVEWPEDLVGRTTVNADVLYIGAPLQAGMMNRMTPAPGTQPGVVPPGMVQTVATQPVPAERIALVPQIGSNGFVTAPTLQPGRIAVTTVDGVPFVITPDRNATPILPNGIYYAGNLHAITETVPGNGISPAPAPVVTYVNIPGYGSLPLFKVENQDFVRLATGALARYIAQDARNGQLIINGTPMIVTTGTTAELPAPAYNAAPVVQPGMGQPGAAVPGAPLSTANPSTPQVGDVRIKWTYVPDTMPISIVAVQTANTFSPYVAENGYTVDLLQTGTKNKAAMFQKAHDSNTMMTWILRFVGWLMMYMGISMILKPLSVLGDVLPIIGNILEFGISIIAFLVASVVALVVIAIAWLAYRPILGITLLVLAVALIVLVIMKKKKAAPAAAPAAPTEEKPETPAE